LYILSQPQPNAQFTLKKAKLFKLLLHRYFCLYNFFNSLSLHHFYGAINHHTKYPDRQFPLKVALLGKKNFSQNTTLFEK